MSLRACSGKSSLAARSSSRPARVSHWPGLGLAAARQLEIVEQEFAQLPRRSPVELVAGQRVDLLLEPGDALGEGGAQA